MIQHDPHCKSLVVLTSYPPQYQECDCQKEYSHTPVWWKGEWWGTRGEQDDWWYWPLFRFGVPSQELKDMAGAIVAEVYDE
jgi:hypothetical protein